MTTLHWSLTSLQRALTAAQARIGELEAHRVGDDRHTSSEPDGKGYTTTVGELKHSGAAKFERITELDKRIGELEAQRAEELNRLGTREDIELIRRERDAARAEVAALKARFGGQACTCGLSAAIAAGKGSQP